MYCYFYIQSGHLCLLIGVFRIFTFNVNIGVVGLDFTCLLFFSSVFLSENRRKCIPNHL